MPDATEKPATSPLSVSPCSDQKTEMIPMPGTYYKPTHVVTVEVKFEVEIDVEATSEEDADKKALAEAEKKYVSITRSSMSDRARRMRFDAVMAEEYVDES